MSELFKPDAEPEVAQKEDAAEALRIAKLLFDFAHRQPPPMFMPQVPEFEKLSAADKEAWIDFAKQLYEASRGRFRKEKPPHTAPLDTAR